MRTVWLSIALSVMCISCNQHATPEKSKTVDYATTVRSSLSVFGWDLNGYFFRATPVGNFGIGTMYLNENTSTDPRVIESHWLLSNPSIWFEEQVSDDVKNTILKRIILIGGYSSFSDESTINRTTSAKLGLPILNVLNVGAGIDLERGITSKISADQAVLRKLVWPEFEDAVISNKLSASVSKVYKKNNYSIAAADIILKGYKVTIEVDRTVNPELSVKLDNAIGTVIGKEGTGSLTFKKVSNGKYEATANEDVVAAVLFKIPPPEQDRGSSALGEWKTATLNPAEVTKLESVLAKH